jgi:DNA polymerase elongation subunit (family B)
MSLFNFGTKRCIHRQDVKHHPNCFNKDGSPRDEMQRLSAKILSVDIETLPILGYTWDVWNTNIYPNQVVKDWCLLAYSAKWMGSPNVISNVLSPKEAITRNDLGLAKELWNLLEEADILIGFNSKRFDIRKINARFWKHGLHKPSSYKHIDIIQTARSVFGLTYNKLDFIAKFLGVQSKLETDFELWKGCDIGDKESLQRMREYNEMDVLIQEEIYFDIREWIPNHINLGIFSRLENVCPICLSSNYKEIGIYVTNSEKYREFRCKCGAVWHDRKTIKL